MLLTLAVILLTALLCSRSKTAAAHAMVILVLVFTAGITVCFIAAAAGGGLAGSRPEPAFIPDRSSFSQVLRILFISPWAFIGFFYFHRIITKDHARRFGKAIIVWIALLAVIILMALIWSGRTEDSAMTASIQSVSNYYKGHRGPGPAGDE